MSEVKELAAMPGVMTTVCDMCAYGLKIADEKGEALMEKRTRFFTNSPELCKTNQPPVHQQCGVWGAVARPL